MTASKRNTRRRTRGIIGATCVAFACPAAAHAQDVVVIDHAQVSPALLAKVERETQRQVNTDLRRYWHTPRIRYVATRTAGAWTIDLEPARRYCEPVVGCHTALDASMDQGWHSCWVPLPQSPRYPACGADATTTYALSATVGTSSATADWEVTFSHELLEMAVDPYQRTFAPGTQAPMEICDPFEQFSYERNGVRLSDFATPAFYGIGRGQRQDYLGVL